MPFVGVTNRMVLGGKPEKSAFLSTKLGFWQPTPLGFAFGIGIVPVRPLSWVLQPVKLAPNSA